MATQQAIFGPLAANYKYSANLTQAIVSFLEAYILFDNKISLDIAYSAVIFVSTFVPPSGIFGYFGPNENLWETIIATLGCGLVGMIGWDRGFGRHALRGFVLSTSSMAVTDEFYTLVLGGGLNLQKLAYRTEYPEANMTNRAFLG